MSPSTFVHFFWKTNITLKKTFQIDPKLFFFSSLLLQWYQNNNYSHNYNFNIWFVNATLTVEILPFSVNLPIMSFPVIRLLLICSFHPFPSNEKMTVFSCLVLSVEQDRRYRNVGVYFHDCIGGQNLFLLQSKALRKSHCTQQNGIHSA